MDRKEEGMDWAFFFLPPLTMLDSLSALLSRISMRSMRDANPIPNPHDDYAVLALCWPTAPPMPDDAVLRRDVEYGLEITNVFPLISGGKVALNRLRPLSAV